MSVCLCTGGAGFIGSHVVDALILAGHEVIVLDNLSTGNIENVNKKAICHYDDIRIDLNHIFEEHNIDYIFHLAAQINLRKSIQEPALDAYTNIYGSLRLIELAIKYKVKKFIFSSTGGAIYDPDATLPWTEQTKCEPKSPYGLSKFTVERYLELAKQNNGLNYACLRYSNVLGPRQNSHGEAGVVSIFIDNILANKDIKIFGDGQQTRDFVYVEDIINANVMALRGDIVGVFNVCTNTEVSVNEIAQKIMDKIPESRSKIIYQDAIVGEVKRTRLCFNKFLALGWKPFFTIETGLDKTLEWFLSR